jgi:protein gp37
MSGKTSIEWCDLSSNPLRAYNVETGKRGWFCVHESEGCRNCYAEKRNVWIGNHLRYAAQNLKNVRFEMNAEELRSWQRLKAGTRVFPFDMTDLFQEGVPDPLIDLAMATMGTSPATFLVLTKRADRLRSYVAVLPNVWFGVSVETQALADLRIHYLLDTPAAVRFLSVEPQLEAIRPPLQRSQCCGKTWLSYTPGSMYEPSSTYCPTCRVALSWPGTTSIAWVIQGGESGPGARPFDVAWARSLRDQCKAGDVAYFLKQLGAHPYEGYLSDREVLEGEKGRPRPADQPLTDEAAVEILANDLLRHVPIPRLIRLKNRKGGDPSEWPEDLRVREFPRKAAK